MMALIFLIVDYGLVFSAKVLVSVSNSLLFSASLAAGKTIMTTLVTSQLLLGFLLPKPG
jgi:hypothetical protein